MNEYYTEKAKDSQQQAVYLMWFMIIVIFIGVLYCAFKWITHKCPEPQPEPLVIELVIEVQEMVGARPDGIVGPEFKRLVNTQCEIDKPEYFNRCAVAVMERMAKEK